MKVSHQKTALILTGGGARAAYQVGVLSAISELLPDNRRNPFPIIVPCHRIVGANGQMTGFSAPGGVETKRQLLKIEGAIERDLFDLMG